MKTIFKIFGVLTLFVFFLSCDRNDDNQTSLPATAGFKWRENSTSATEKTAGSAELRTAYKSIFAFQGSTATSGTIFEINLTGVTPGTYNLGGGNAIAFTGASVAPSSGKVIITANANGKASGTLEVFYPSGSVTSVYATFTDIPVN